MAVKFNNINVISFALFIIVILVFVAGLVFTKPKNTAILQISTEDASDLISPQFNSEAKQAEFIQILDNWKIINDKNFKKSGTIKIIFTDLVQGDGQIRMPKDVAVASSYSFENKGDVAIINFHFNHNKLNALGDETELRYFNHQILEAILFYSKGINISPDHFAKYIKSELNFVDTSPIENISYLVLN